MRKEREAICKNCGKTFKTRNKHPRCCSRSCESQFRWKDKEKREHHSKKMKHRWEDADFREKMSIMV
ncbi:MAG TPA: hypothetical protein P5509_11275 [Bacteroidales bacterium]|nr:hypothetical protein [Bacteroidales bacterium]